MVDLTIFIVAQMVYIALSYMIDYKKSLFIPELITPPKSY